MALVENSVVEQRYRAVLAVQRGEPKIVVAAQFGVSRQTLHTWLTRYARHGLAGLIDRTHRPPSCPHQAPAEVETTVCEPRREHPAVDTRVASYNCDRPHQALDMDYPASGFAPGQQARETAEELLPLRLPANLAPAPVSAAAASADPSPATPTTTRRVDRGRPWPAVDPAARVDRGSRVKGRKAERPGPGRQNEPDAPPLLVV
jgi:transposase-like protein